MPPSLSTTERNTNGTTAQLRWQSPDPVPRLIDALRLVAGMSVYFAAMLLVVGLITFALVSVVVLLRGEDWLDIAAGWLDPSLWWGGALLCIAIPAPLIPWMLLFKDVEAFHFDSTTQVLEIVERRAWLPAVTRRWPFSAIMSLQPVIGGSTRNYLWVTLKAPKGKILQLTLGEGVAQATLTDWARWLAPHFGEQLQALYYSSPD